MNRGLLRAVCDQIAMVRGGPHGTDKVELAFL